MPVIVGPPVCCPESKLYYLADRETLICSGCGTMWKKVKR